MWSVDRFHVAVRSIPGTCVRTIDPGENPSLRFHSVGSIGTPATLRGMPVSGRLMRRPVSVVGSATVKWSLGNGRRQAAGSTASHQGGETGSGIVGVGAARTPGREAA